MAGLLSGQVAFITGGGRGIGRGIAQEFAREGASVAVMARSQDQITETVALVEKAGARGIAVTGDVTIQADVETAIAETESRLGPINVLVSNAGITGPFAPITEVDPDEWWRTQEVHLRGAFLCSRTVIPGMKERGGGRIIIISSRAAERGGPNFSGYQIAKASQLRLTESIAAEGAEYGIRAFVLHPGLVDTQFTDDALTRPDAQKYAPQFIARLNTLRDNPASGNPMSQVTGLCAFLASGQGDGLSGRYISVDDDVAELARNAQKIQDDDLYTLRLRTLNYVPAGHEAGGRAH
jgi:NAD(P)-dependent dehydrogenase (short-subunit alcohol dehydrogenase family)